MKLEDLKSVVEVTWSVRFEGKLENFCSDLHVTTNIKTLYEDWYSDECMLCPENDTVVYNVMLGNNAGQVYLIETGNKFTFLELIEFFKRHLDFAN